MTITPGSIVSEGYNFRSIVDAIERIILLYRPTVPRQYDANYRGIVDALLDLGDILGGIVGAPSAPITSSVGQYPPGWVSSTQSYSKGPPADGALFFDIRQGRLFVAEGGEWYQTNGAEAFVHVGFDAPPRQVNGQLWFDLRQGKLFCYVDAVASGGAAGWYQTNGGGDGGALKLGELSNVDDSATAVVPAVDETGLIVRDNRRALTDANAYVSVDHLDLGVYAP